MAQEWAWGNSREKAFGGSLGVGVGARFFPICSVLSPPHRTGLRQGQRRPVCLCEGLHGATATASDGPLSAVRQVAESTGDREPDE